MANTVDLFDDYNDENVALCDGFDLLCNVEFFVKAIENQNHTQIQINKIKKIKTNHLKQNN